MDQARLRSENWGKTAASMLFLFWAVSMPRVGMAEAFTCSDGTVVEIVSGPGGTYQVATGSSQCQWEFFNSRSVTNLDTMTVIGPRPPGRTVTPIFFPNPGITFTSPIGGGSVNPSTSITGQAGCRGNPIIPGTGNKIEPELDFTTSGELPLHLNRTYNHYWQGAGLFGRHWVSNFDYKLTFGTTALNSCYPRPGGGTCGIGSNTTIYSWRPDGSTIKYTRNADGFFYEDKPGPLAKIERRTDGRFVLWNAQGGYEIYSSAGYVEAIQDRNNVRWTFSYVNGTYPSRVTHTSGRYVEFTWTNGQLTAVRDPAGNYYGYSYTANAFGTGFHRLAASAQPGSPATSTTYHYELTSDKGALTGKSISGVRYSTFTYDANGYATSSHHGGLDKYTFAYTPGADGKLTVLETNPLSKKTTYVFQNGKPLSITGHPSTYCPGITIALTEYDVNGYPAMTSDFNGNDTAYAYNAQGQLMEMVEAVGTSAERTTSYEWWGAAVGSQVLAVTIEGLSRTEYHYHANGRPSRITVKNLTTKGVPNQVRTTWYYYSFHASSGASANAASEDIGTGDSLPPQALGMLATMRVDGPVAGNVDEITTSYDAFGNILSAKNQLGHGLTYSSHNGLGLPGRIQNANAGKVDFLYDARGKLTRVRAYPNGVASDTLYTYNGYGDAASIKTPDGVTTNLEYGAARRLTRRYVNSTGVLAGGGTQEEERYAYNAAGNLIRSDVYVTQGHYERQFRCLQPVGAPPSECAEPEWEQVWVVSPVLKRSSMADYDELGRVRSRRGNAGQDVRFTYDNNGNVKTIVDQALGRTTTLTYDALDRVIQSKDPNNGLAKFEYDDGDRITKVIDPRSRATTFVYDGFGQLWSQVSPDSGTTIYAYDAAGLQTSIKRANGVQTNFAYDDLGRLTTASNSSGQQTFSYDTCTSGKGLVCKLTSPQGSIAFTYAADGRLASQREMIGSFTWDQAFTYDGAGRLAGIGYTGDVSVGYGYVAGKLTTMTATVGGVAKMVVSGIKYEPFGPAAEWTYGNGVVRDYNYDMDGRITGISSKNGSVVLQSLTYAYNADDTIKAITNAFNPISGGQYTYDVLSRLTKYVTGANGIGEYTYDASGNRTSVKFSGSHQARTDTYSIAASSNRLMGISGGQNLGFTYDANGNTLTNRGVTYAYDAFNRMRTAAKAGQPTVTYWTNALGLRTYKTQGSPKATQFVHGPDRQLAIEYNHTGWVRTHYLRMGGELVAVVRGGQIYYAHNDHLGRTEMLTNSAKTRVWYANNYPFNRGEVSDQVGGFNLGFPGQYWDAETSTWYNGFRDYDQETGRYLQSDPIGLRGGINTYAYVLGNPVNLVDSLGLKPGDCYPTADIAGANALGDILSTSIRQGREYAGWVYRTSNGWYSYTAPRIGGASTSSPGPRVVGATGSYHTHGAYKPGHRNEMFGLADTATHVPGDVDYLGTPSGRMLRNSGRGVPSEIDPPSPGNSDSCGCGGSNSMLNEMLYNWGIK